MSLKLSICSFLIAAVASLNFIILDPLNAQEITNFDELFKKAWEVASEGNRKEAREICNTILEEKPSSYDVRVFLGRLYAWDKEYESARRELKKVLNDRSDYKEAIKALIDVEYWSDNFQHALIYCNEGLIIYPNNEYFLLKKAKILEKKDDFTSASLVLNRLLVINPTNEEAIRLLEKIKLTALKNKASVRYRFDKFERPHSRYGPWHLVSFELSTKFRFVSLTGRANYANRSFGSRSTQGSQFELDAYPKITKGLYGYLNAGYSSSSIFPKYRAGAELFKGLPMSFEASLGVRHLYFSRKNVFIYTGYIGKYYKNYWFSFRPFITPKSSGLSFSGNISIRRYFDHGENYLARYWSTAGNYMTFFFGFGSSPVEILFLEEIERLNSYKIGLDFQKMITKTILIKATFRFEREEFRLDKPGNRFTLSMGLQHFF